MKPGDVCAVSGGYGLMQVKLVDGEDVQMCGHGPFKSGHWFRASRLSAPVGRDVILREREEARARGVACNSPECWCRSVTEERP